MASYARTYMLKKLTGSIYAAGWKWMQHGGLWRRLLMLGVGGISITTLSGLTGFLTSSLLATVNAVFIAFLMCLSAVGAFLALFCISLTIIYIGGLAATASAFGSAVVMASSAVLFFTGWLLFAWGIWEVIRMSLNLVRGFFRCVSPMTTTSTITTTSAMPTTRASHFRVLRVFNTQNGQ